MNEIWVEAKYLTAYSEVLLFENYEVSNLGRVRNKKFDRPIAISNTNDGYKIVGLSKKGKTHYCRLHRLVLSSFSNNIDGSLDVSHIDEDKANNALSNLIWAETRYNCNYGTRNTKIGKKSKVHRVGVSSSKRSVEQYDLNGVFIEGYKSIHDAHRKTGANVSDICLCCKGVRRTAKGYIWKYKN